MDLYEDIILPAYLGGLSEPYGLPSPVAAPEASLSLSEKGSGSCWPACWFLRWPLAERALGYATQGQSLQAAVEQLEGQQAGRLPQAHGEEEGLLPLAQGVD